MSMNFGPLNRQGGERRLNVAITRATTEVIVFASFDASMIDLTRTSAEAVKDLKHYLNFAARGPVALGEAIQSVSSSDYDSDFEIAVSERVRALDWTVRTQVGVSKYRIDLGVVHPDAPGRFLAAIECDGATYHSSPSARDRDRVRHIILEQLGWRVLRVWSTDFFLDPDASAAKLDVALRELLEADRAAARDVAADVDCTVLPSSDTWDGTGEGSDQNDGGDDQRPQGEMFRAADETSESDDSDAPENLLKAEADFEPSPSSRVSSARHLSGLEGVHSPSCDPDRFYEPGYRSRLKAMATAVIDAEGPITFKRLSDRLARAHGFQRTGRQISSTVWAVCKPLRRYIATPDGHKVFWPDGMPPEGLFRYRGPTVNGERRDWREVPHPEKLWLVREILESGTDDPARSVADKIGFSRITTQFRAEISELVRHLKRARPG